MAVVALRASPRVSFEDKLGRVDRLEIDHDMLTAYSRPYTTASEISLAESALRSGARGAYALKIVLLHGGLPPGAQDAAFPAAPRGKTKVILFTNVAETYITISDCTVADTCWEKRLSYDPHNQMLMLLDGFVS